MPDPIAPPPRSAGSETAVVVFCAPTDVLSVPGVLFPDPKPTPVMLGPAIASTAGAAEVCPQPAQIQMMISVASRERMRICMRMGAGWILWRRRGKAHRYGKTAGGITPAGVAASSVSDA